VRPARALRRRRRRGPFGAVVTVALLCAGCLVVPTGEWATSRNPTRGRIERGALDTIQPGVTTREDVLLRLGEPDATLRDERLFGYCWSMNVAVFIPLVSGPATGLPRRYLLLIEFDEEGRVKRSELKSAFLWTEASLPLREIDRW